MQIIIVLRLLVLAIVLFASEKLPVDVTTLLLLVGLVASDTRESSTAIGQFVTHSSVASSSKNALSNS
jgi:hypothetical protein